MEEIIKQMKEKISKTEKTIADKFNEEEEEDLTARLLANLERDFKGIDSKNYSIKTHIFKRRSPRPMPEESFFGADFVIWLTLNENDYKVDKHFLAQSKKVSDKNKLNFDSNLLEQCKKMIQFTSDSFIFVYTTQGIYIKSALNRLLAYKNLGEFLEDFLNCFIGDTHIIYDKKYTDSWHPNSNFFDSNNEEVTKKLHLLHIIIEAK